MAETTVYLIDDEPEMLDFLSDTVEMAGLKAESYTRASMFFDKNPAVTDGSIIVLDLNMPEMDGIEVMRRLSKMDNPPKLILISGHDSGVLHSAEKLGKAQSLEIIATLNKPVSFDTLRQTLERHASVIVSRKRKATLLAGQEFTPEDIKDAIRLKQLMLHFQPQIDIKSRMFTGVEALIRWRHPVRGIVYPDLFIPVAEHSGHMEELTSLVIDMAVEQQKKWQSQGLHTGISVNISAENITSLTLPEQLAGLLERRKLDPGVLTLEVTESALMGELVTSLDILTRLRLKGISLSIDDFGTGYSSLSQLHRVPFTELKIDRSFVMNMVADEQARAIVKTCIMLGHELDMQVVAEGVETRKHLDILHEMDCDIAQGYYISRPEPADIISNMLNKRVFQV